MFAPIANHEAQATNIKWSHGALVDLTVQGFARLYGETSVTAILALIKEYTRISTAVSIYRQSKDDCLHVVSDFTWRPSGLFNNLRWTFHATLSDSDKDAADGWGISFPDHGIGFCAAGKYQGKVAVELTGTVDDHEMVHLWLEHQQIWKAKGNTKWEHNDVRRFRMSLTGAACDWTFCDFKANSLYLYCVSNSLFALNDSTS